MQGVRACHGMDSAGMVLDAGAGLAVTRSYFVACQFFCCDIVACFSRSGLVPGCGGPGRSLEPPGATVDYAPSSEAPLATSVASLPPFQGPPHALRRRGIPCSPPLSSAIQSIKAATVAARAG